MISSQDLNQINLALISMMVLKEINLLELRFIVELYTDFSENPEILTSKVLASPYVGFLFNKVILGTTGNDWLYGTDQNDIILGNSGDDRLYGGDGNDILIGGAGNDYMDGGRGSDTYVFNRGDGQDTIYDYRYSANEMNVIQFGEGVTKEDVIFAQDGNDLLIKIKGTDDSLRVKYWFDRWSFNSYRGFIFRFADGTELKAEEVERIVYSGTAGDDVLYGVEKDDVIEGGSGNDRLYGYGGNDTLIGGPGNDYMEGGEGNDTYVFGKGDGQDTIYEYKSNNNDINIITINENKENIIFSKNRNDLIIGYSDKDYIKVLYQFNSKNYGIDKIEVKDGYYITRWDIENIVNAMIDFTNDKGMSYAEMYNNLLNNQNVTMLLSQSWSKSWVDSMGVT
jgi:Ca2+-binding RTX toxin-like protein